MAASLILLPDELLEAIFSHLGYAQLSSIATLSRSSKQWHRRFEPLLYTRQGILDRAMRWGCKHGAPDVVKHAISCGASLSTVKISGHGIPTLYLAARSGQTEIFKLLLHQGAVIDAPTVSRELRRGQHKRIVRHFCRRKMLTLKPDLVCLFFRMSLHDPLRREKQCGALFDPLARLIQAGASTLLVQILLDEGADPDGICIVPGKGELSPLSAAIMAGSVSTFNLLLGYGADIQGTKLATEPYYGLHIPIFAAAYSVASYQHGMKMMQMCLDAGADINQCVLVKGFESTPVCIFLETIISQRDPVKTIDGLKFILSKGALVNNLGDKCRKKCRSSLDIVLRTWGDSWDDMLEDHSLCLEIVGILTRHGAAVNDRAHLLIHYVRPNRDMWMANPTSFLDEKVKLAEFVLAGMQTEEAHGVLSRFILALGRDQHQFQRLNQRVLELLVAAGANVNEFIPDDPRWTGGCPILHRLCHQINENTRLHECGQLCDSKEHMDPGGRMTLLWHVINLGADPNIQVDGKNAAEWLLFKAQDCNECTRAYLENLAAVVRHERGDPEYCSDCWVRHWHVYRVGKCTRVSICLICSEVNAIPLACKLRGGSPLEPRGGLVDSI